MRIQLNRLHGKLSLNHTLHSSFIFPCLFSSIDYVLLSRFEWFIWAVHTFLSVVIEGWMLVNTFTLLKDRHLFTDVMLMLISKKSTSPHILLLLMTMICICMWKELANFCLDQTTSMQPRRWWMVKTLHFINKWFLEHCFPLESEMIKWEQFTPHTLLFSFLIRMLFH